MSLLSSLIPSWSFQLDASCSVMVVRVLFSVGRPRLFSSQNEGEGAQKEQEALQLYSCTFKLYLQHTKRIHLFSRELVAQLILGVGGMNF